MLDRNKKLRHYMNASILTLAFFSIGLQDLQAASSGYQFTVQVNLQNSSDVTQPDSAFCHSNDLSVAFGATVNFVCATGNVVDIYANNQGIPGKSAPGGGFRYLLHVPSVGYILGPVDGYIGIGSVLTWRQIKFNDLDYLEMMVGW